MTTSQPETKTESSTDIEQALRLRYRIRFSKTGLLRWTSHRDLARLWERIVRRALLKPSMTEGFNPKPRIGFPSALALGTSGENEVAEIDFAEALTAPELLDRLCQDDQPGLAIKSVQMLPEESGKAKILHADYVITPPDPDLMDDPMPASEWIIERIEALLAESTVTVTRKKKPLTVNVSQRVLNLQWTDAIQLRLAASDSATLKPTDVLDLIGCSDWIEHGSQVIRTDVVLQREFETTDPEFLAIANQTSPSATSTPRGDLI